jgi:Sortase domain
MRVTAAGRAATVVMLLVAAVTVRGSQAAENAQPRLAAASAAATAEPLTADTFRSVRSYADVAEVAEPVRLRIPAAGVDTPLVRLGRAADGSIEVPALFDVAGWFGEGPRPGQPGPAVVLGHVDSRTGPAVFYRVAALVRNAQVVVDRADGSTVAFRVSGVQRVSKVEFPTDLVYGPTLESSLRLVTCGGSFDRATGTYRDNVIVYADPAG